MIKRREEAYMRKEENEKVREARTEMFVEVFCNWDSSILVEVCPKVKKMEMVGRRLIINIASCDECMLRNQDQGIKLTIDQIKKSARETVDTMREVLDK